MNLTHHMKEYRPMNKGFCPKCGSSNIIPHRKIITSSVETVSSPTIRLYEKMGTLKGKLHDYPLIAWVCGECGYTEWFASNPSELYSVYQRIQQTRLAQGKQTEESEEDYPNKTFLIIMLGLMILLSITAIVIIIVLFRR
jgi:ribosomal protein S27AE